MNKILSLYFPKWNSDKTADERRKMLEKMAEWAYRFSPVVGVDDSPERRQMVRGRRRELDLRNNGIHLDLTGTERLLSARCLSPDGGPTEGRFLESLRDFFRSRDVEVRMALAPTLGGGWALSRYGASALVVVGPEELSAAVRQLPVSALRLEEELEQSLLDVNIVRIDQLLAISRRQLYARFGDVLLKRLEQLFGEREEPIRPIRAQAPLRVERIFEGPTFDQQAIMATGEELLHRIVEGLLKIRRKASSFRIFVKTADQPVTVKSFFLSVPTLNERHIWALLSRYLENVQLGYGVESLAIEVLSHEEVQVAAVPVLEESAEQSLQMSVAAAERAELTAAGTLAGDVSYRSALAELKAQQVAYRRTAGVSSRRADYGALLDSFAEHLGAGSMKRLECRESYVPEKSAVYAPASTKKTSRPARLVKADRPSILFPQARPITAIALLPDSPPKSIRWGEQVFPVVRGIGPERILPEWFTTAAQVFKDGGASAETRDYFRLQLMTGLWVWVYRDIATQRWFLHGIWA